ncbi:uncharacterized protein LOC135152175 [Daucus carota subsp. sativus]|uniref:uncharacterized protein LOC135152175 n=1 Tax=Daucus carota subsp. sativus TaxID=79200 RepID=UPI003083BAA2
MNLDDALQLILVESLDPIMYNAVVNCTNAKQIWDTLEIINEGSEEVRENKKEILMAQYEQFGSNPGEGISEVFIRFNNLINNLNLNGKYYDNKEMNLKFLLTLPEHLEHRITAIRESRDLHEISLERLYGVLKTYELEQVQTKQRYGWGKTLGNSRALIVETPQLEEKKDVVVPSKTIQEFVFQKGGSSSSSNKGGYKTGMVDRTEGKSWDDTDSDEEEQLGNVAFMARSGLSSPPHAGSSLVDPICPKLFMQLGLDRDDAIKKLKAAILKNNALIEEERIRCKAFKDASTLVKEINDQQEINRTVGIGYDYNKSVGKGARGIVRVVWVLDKGASRHMTGMNSLLTEVKEPTGPSVTFADNRKGRTVGYGKYKETCTIKHIKNERPSLFGIRKGDIYVADLSSGPGNAIQCFYAKASTEDSWLWHKKLSHLNFKTMNSLVKRDLVRGLPSLEFTTDDLCEACQKGKAKRASHKSKTINSITDPLQLLHMDLFGPVNVMSIDGGRYALPKLCTFFAKSGAFLSVRCAALNQSMLCRFAGFNLVFMESICCVLLVRFAL